MPNNNTIGEAYLQIKPSMDGISKDIQSAMGDAGSKGSSSFGSAFASGLKKIGTVALSATAAATTAVSAFGAKAVKAFGSFEQLEGGVKKLYGDAADEIMKYADQAYKTSGMSANDYMETATSFSASLINSLGGDVSKAAQMTDVAMRAMSDNVNTFGSDFESVQNAFKGFSKGNFTMLDNLKLGYGGTKEEMERLLRDAEKYGNLVEESLKADSFSDIITAVQLIQEKLNVAGTTGKEAMTTIEGSATATKAAWQNVITAIGRGEGISDAMNALMSSLFGEKEGEGLVNQILPRIKTVMKEIGNFIKKAGPIIAKTLPNLISDLVSSVLPSLLSSGVSLAGALIKSLAGTLPRLKNVVMGIIEDIIDAIEEQFSGAIPIIEMLRSALKTVVKVLETAVSWVSSFIKWLNGGSEGANAFASALTVIAIAVGTIVTAVKAYNAVMGIVKLATEAWTAAQAVLNAVMTANPIGLIIAGIVALIAVIALLVTHWEEVTEFFKEGFAAIGEFASKTWEGIKNVWSGITGWFSNLWNNVKEAALQWGRDLIQNFKNGILQKWEDLKAGIRGIAEGIKSFLGFSEPDEGPLSNFHTYAPDMMKLFAKGIKDNESLVYDQIADSFDFGGKIGDFGVVADENRTVNLGGTIRIEGVNNQGEFLAASEYAIEEIITNIMKREARMA